MEGHFNKVLIFLQTQEKYYGTCKETGKPKRTGLFKDVPFMACLLGVPSQLALQLVQLREPLGSGAWQAGDRH